MKYKVGDKVRVRQWDDMMEEFGKCEYSSNNIDTPIVPFVSSMKKYCGAIVTIETVKEHWYYIAESDDPCMWTDDMIEDVYYTRKFLNEYKCIFPRNLFPDPILMGTRDALEYFCDTKKEEEIMNTETKKEEKKQLTQRERLEQKLEECREESAVESVKVIVPNKVVEVVIKERLFGFHRGGTFKMVCDDQDTFSIERAIILAFVKSDDFGRDLTPEGVEAWADRFLYSKTNVKRVKNAMKVYKAEQDLIKYEEKEKAERERIHENKKKKKIAQKVRRIARLETEKKLKEEQEQKKQIAIQTEAFKAAFKDVLNGYNLPEKKEIINENHISVEA